MESFASFGKSFHVLLGDRHCQTFSVDLLLEFLKLRPPALLPWPDTTVPRLLFVIVNVIAPVDEHHDALAKFALLVS